MLLKLITEKNVYFATISILIMNSNFKTPFAMAGIAFITVKSLDYPCIVNDIRKPDAIHLLENSVFDDCRYKVNNHYFESLIKAKKNKKMKVF